MPPVVLAALRPTVEQPRNEPEESRLRARDALRRRRSGPIHPQATRVPRAPGDVKRTESLRFGGATRPSQEPDPRRSLRHLPALRLRPALPGRHHDAGRRAVPRLRSAAGRRVPGVRRDDRVGDAGRLPRLRHAAAARRSCSARRSAARPSRPATPLVEQRHLSPGARAQKFRTPLALTRSAARLKASGSALEPLAVAPRDAALAPRAGHQRHVGAPRASASCAARWRRRDTPAGLPDARPGPMPLRTCSIAARMASAVAAALFACFFFDGVVERRELVAHDAEAARGHRPRSRRRGWDCRA